MASIRYYNQAGPFWDFIADLEAQGFQRPLFNHSNAAQAGGQQAPMPGPWAWAFGNRQQPHPAFGMNADAPTQESDTDGRPDPAGDESATPVADQDMPPRSQSPLPPAGAEERPRGERSHGNHGHRGRHGRGGCFPRGHGGFDQRGGRRGWARHGGFGPGGPFNMNALAALLNEQFFSGGRTNPNDVGPQGHAEDFKPHVDVFDTETSYVLHVSLPGAQKEDVDISWDADKSEVSITGVVHRPGDEEFLKTLALDERQVGAFERKVRLGSRANPAQVDSEAISARLDAGILTIELPKEDRDYVDVKKVDIS